MSKIPTWLLLSILTHLAALALCIARPQTWPLILGVLATNHGVLFLASLWPRSRLLGPNLRRLPANAYDQVALTFDDGPHPNVTPRVLEILAAHGARATFFCVGERAVACPDIVQAIVAAGHRVENHSYRHAAHFAFWLPKPMARDIARAQDILMTLTGERPSYFRAPAGMRNPAMGLVLTGLGLELVSWTRRGLDTMTNDPQRVLRRLTRDLRAGDILLLHDGSSALTRDGTPVVLQVLPRLLERLAREGFTGVPIPPPAAQASVVVARA